MTQRFALICGLVIGCISHGNPVRGAWAQEAQPPTSNAVELPAVPSVTDQSTALPSQLGGQPVGFHWSDWLKDHDIGDWQLDVGGSLRDRFEHQDQFNIRRYGDPDEAHDTLVLQRFRLDVDLRRQDVWRCFLQLQDARPFGTNFSKDDFLLGNPYWNYLDVRQAYIERRTGTDSPAGWLGFRVGRQAVTYADTRVWGPAEWGNVGRYAWDVAKLIVDVPVVQVDFIFGKRVLYDPGGWDIHHYPFHAYGVYAMMKSLPYQLDFFYIRKESYGDPTGRLPGIDAGVNINTFGFYIDGKWHEQWDYGGTFAHSFGQHDFATVEAYGANARLGYTLQRPWKPRVSAQYSYGSGDSAPGRGRYRTFDGLFGAIDSMYGWMNIFAWQNLRDYQATLNLQPTDKTSLTLDWHYFQLDAAQDAWYYSSGRPQRQDPTGASGRELGHELDFFAIHRWSDHLQFRTGYSHFFPGSFIRNTGTSPQADWVYFQTLYEF